MTFKFQEIEFPQTEEENEAAETTGRAN